MPRDQRELGDRTINRNQPDPLGAGNVFQNNNQNDYHLVQLRVDDQLEDQLPVVRALLNQTREQRQIHEVVAPMLGLRQAPAVRVDLQNFNNLVN